MKNKPVNLKEKLAKFSDHWAPRVIAEMNDYQFKLVKLKGEFVWHTHEQTDETFFVIRGKMSIAFRDRHVKLSEGDLFVVPKGRPHQPSATDECEVLVIEPGDVVNTGDAESELTAENDVWI